MTIRFQRTGVVDRNKHDEASAFAAEVSEYVTENWGITLEWGMQLGGTYATIHWFSDYDDMAAFEAGLMRTIMDEGYRALLKKAGDYFLPGSIQDSIIYMM